MNVLAVDTTGDALSLALRAGERVFKLRRVFKAPHDETLLPQIDRLLKKAGLKPSGLDAIAAASGPGRFTGIRVGMAYAAVAAGELGIPALAVSRLEAAAGRAQGRLVCAVVPGWRDEKFYQVFRGAAAASPPVWADPNLWRHVHAEMKAKRAVFSECEPDASDLLAPALRYLRRRRRPRFEPLYLKPASYENKHPARHAR